MLNFSKILDNIYIYIYNGIARKTKKSMRVEEEKSSECEFDSYHAQRFLRIAQIASNARDNEKRKGSVNYGVNSMP